MQWTRTRIVLNVWSASDDFRIIEDPQESPERRFRLEAFSQDAVDPEFFASLKQAQGAAALRNELELLRQDNLRLRAELDQANGRWPADFEPPTGWTEEDMEAAGEEFKASVDEAVEQYERDASAKAALADCGPDGRGVPKSEKAATSNGSAATEKDPWF